MIARPMNVILGIWLFLSAFLWTHATAQAVNAWIVGVLCVTFALVATRVPNIRHMNTALAIWLFISAFVLPTSGVPREDIMTISNNILAAVVIFALSLLADTMKGKDTGPRQPRQRTLSSIVFLLES